MIGKFAASKAGHDKDRIYVIVAQEGSYVYLCDGRLRTKENPKKKKIRHIQIINRTIEEELPDRLRNDGAVSDEQIKYAIKHLENR